MHLVAAPDKFRGTSTASDAAAAMALAAEQLGWSCTQLPLADGGEGTLDAFGGANRRAVVTGPNGVPLKAGWRMGADVAVIEMALASGLELAGGAQRNDPMRATSRGTGELIAEAVRSGARRIIVGVGGSACTDGGAGAVQVLTDLPPLDGSVGIEVLVAVDVTTRFADAAKLFAPQKGATPEQCALLDQRLDRLLHEHRRLRGIDIAPVEGGGAGGGLAGALAALGARIGSGFDLIADELRLADAIAKADLVVTGEGKLDESSYLGKVVGGVLVRAAAADVAPAAVVGTIATAPRCPTIGLVEELGVDAALYDTEAAIASATRTLLSAYESQALVGPGIQ